MDIKRFEIYPILQSIRLNERIGFQITCVEVNNNDIYLGTLDSFIFFYKNVLEQKTLSNQTPQHKYLSSKKSIIQLKIASVLDRLLCVCDSTLIGLNLNSLEVNNNLRVKNVYAFCLNENPISMDPFSIELCLVKKKCICICQLQADKITTLKEVNVPEQPLLVSMDGYYVCIATDSNYYMLDWQSGSSQLLCSNDTNSFMKPIVKHVSRNEFLINGLSHLGIFVKTSGISERPPIDWGMDVQRIAYSYPYILCLKKYSIAIISVIDSQLKEEFLFENGVYIDNFDGKILISSNDSIYFLRRIPWEEQIDSLLTNGKSQEAIDLCASLYESGLISNLDLDYAKLVRVKAGLMELSRDNFELAQQYLIDSEFDIEIFLNCYQSINAYLQLEPEESDFAKTILSEVKTKITDNPSLYVSFLIMYIKELMSQNKFIYTSIAPKINTCLLILYLDDVSKYYGLIEQFFTSEFKFEFKCIESYLQDHKLYHLMALLYSTRSEHHENAIDLWKRLEKGQLNDSHYSGLSNLSGLLKKCANSKLILNHIEFVLERNQNDAVDVLIANTRIDNDKFVILEPEHVITLLHKYRRALIIYLEFLVFELKIKSAHIHTSLTLIYIEIISLQQETEEESSSLCESIVQKLKNLLQTSNLYDPQIVLKCLVKNGLDYESAFLYGKMGNHLKAFEIYLDKYMDHDQALKHCTIYSHENNQIFSTLFSVYLELYRRNGPEMMKPLLNFINHSKCHFDLADILQQLPPNWPLRTVYRLLSNNIRTTSSEQYQSSMGKVLSLSQLERIKQEQRQLTRKAIYLDNESVCIICNTKLFESKFVWIPSTDCYLHDYCYSTSS